MFYSLEYNLLDAINKVYIFTTLDIDNQERRTNEGIRRHGMSKTTLLVSLHGHFLFPSPELLTFLTGFKRQLTVLIF